MNVEKNNLLILTLISLIINFFIINIFTISFLVVVLTFWIEFLYKKKSFQNMLINYEIKYKKVFIKERFPLKFTLKNNSNTNLNVRLLPSNKINNFLPSIKQLDFKPNEKKSFVFQVVFHKRGEETFNEGSVSYSGIFNLYELSRIIKIKEKIKVLPANIFGDFNKESLKKLIPEKNSNYRILEDTTYIEKINEYNNEPMNRIHWKLSAKMNDLLVKKYAFTSTGKLYIVTDLNIEKNSSIDNYIWHEMRKNYEEYAILCSLALIRSANEKKQEIKLTVNGNQIYHADYKNIFGYYDMFSYIRGDDSSNNSFRKILSSVNDKVTMEDTVIIISMFLNKNVLAELIKLKSSSSKIIVLLMPYCFRFYDEAILERKNMYRKEILELENEAKLLVEHNIIVRIVSFNNTLSEVFANVP